MQPQLLIRFTVKCSSSACQASGNGWREWGREGGISGVSCFPATKTLKVITWESALAIRDIDIRTWIPAGEDFSRLETKAGVGEGEVDREEKQTMFHFLHIRSPLTFSSAANLGRGSSIVDDLFCISLQHCQSENVNLLPPPAAKGHSAYCVTCVFAVIPFTWYCSGKLKTTLRVGAQPRSLCIID